jgi:hypothetical protein
MRLAERIPAHSEPLVKGHGRLHIGDGDAPGGRECGRAGGQLPEAPRGSNQGMPTRPPPTRRHSARATPYDMSPGAHHETAMPGGPPTGS